MKNLSVMLLAVVLGLSVTIVTAADWTSGRQGGGTVTVDPDTRRATITRDGVTAPLWNGAHRMEDGSVLIINRGTAVPGEPPARPRQLPPPDTADWEGVMIVGYSPCEQLARHVCGRQNECAAVEACRSSQQLLAMEQDERTMADDGARMTYTSGQCLEAIRDVEYFSVCRPGK